MERKRWASDLKTAPKAEEPCFKILEIESKIWIEDALQITVSEDLATDLRDGVILSKLMLRLSPGCLREPKPSTTVFKMREVVGEFLNAAKKYGLSTTFRPNELVSQSNLIAVYTSIHDLAKVAEKKGFQPLLRPVDSVIAKELQKNKEIPENSPYEPTYNYFIPTDYNSTPLTYKEVKQLEDLPIDCLIRIAQFLNDPLLLSILSKKFYSVIQSDTFSMSLFLKNYGEDFWGQYVGLHPYKSELIPKEFNPFVEVELTDAISLAEKLQKMQQINEIGANNKWSKMLQTYNKMLKLWQTPCNCAFLVAGLPQSGKSTVLELLQQDSDFQLESKIDSFCKIKIVRGSVSAISAYGESTTSRWKVNICEISKPRNWYPKYRGCNAEYMYIIYVVDSVAFATDAQYKKDLYTEFHGMLGEAAESQHTAVGLVCSKQGDQRSARVRDVIHYLRICPVKIDRANIDCQFYAGPVTFCVWGTLDLKSNDAKEHFHNLRTWLSKQPSIRPHKDVPFPLSLGRLVENQGGGWGWVPKTYR